MAGAVLCAGARRADQPARSAGGEAIGKGQREAGWIGLERGREFSLLGETVQDVLAEAREELVQADKPTVDRT